MTEPIVAPELSDLFRSFADEVRSSPLYMRLCPLLADLPTAMTMMSRATTMQRRPNLLLAALHASLLRDAAHPLAEWFPTVGGVRSPDDGRLSDALADFVSQRADELQHLVARGATQTNEPGRSGVLFPALADIAADAGPIGLVEVGASAGLNLRLDSYQYTYQLSDSVARFGNPETAVHIQCDASQSVTRLPLDNMRSLHLGYRSGVDLNPLDVDDELQARWLQALVWPDEPGRCSRLGAALALARTLPVSVRQGDAVDSIEALIAEVPETLRPVIVTTWVMTYLPPDRRVAFCDAVKRIGATRPLTWLFMEHPSYAAELPFPEAIGSPVGTPVVRFDLDGGAHSSKQLAETHPHGTWMIWH